MTKNELYIFVMDTDNSPFTIEDLVIFSGLSTDEVEEVTLSVMNDIGTDKFSADEGYYNEYDCCMDDSPPSINAQVESASWDRKSKERLNIRKEILKNKDF